MNALLIVTLVGVATSPRTSICSIHRPRLLSFYADRAAAPLSRPFMACTWT